MELIDSTQQFPCIVRRVNKHRHHVALSLVVVKLLLLWIYIFLKVDHLPFYQVTEVSGVWIWPKLLVEMHSRARILGIFLKFAATEIKLCMVPWLCTYLNLLLGHRFKGKPLPLLGKKRQVVYLDEYSSIFFHDNCGHTKMSLCQ